MASVLERPSNKRLDAQAAKKIEKSPVLGGRPTKEERMRFSRFSWATVTWLVAVHLSALAAPFFFSWQAIVLTVVLHWFTGGLGICLGYHRLLTHTGMKTYNWVRYVFASIGSLAGEGSPLDWVANHRKHHQLSDLPGDPHSPHDGGWWSHMIWLCFATYETEISAHHRKYVPDMLRDRGMRVMHYMFLPLNIALGLTLMGVGYAVGGWYMAGSYVFWGMFVRMCFVLHSTWLVNSASHMFGYRNYETTDDSRNNWFVALLTYGEGWHNNHHAFPRLARHGHKWWEIDLTYMFIRLMAAVGLVWDVVDLEKGKRGAAVQDAA